MRVMVTAVMTVVSTPNTMVSAKPFTGPDPHRNRMTAAISIVAFESMMVAKARVNPASSAETRARPLCTSSRMRS